MRASITRVTIAFIVLAAAGIGIGGEIGKARAESVQEAVTGHAGYVAPNGARIRYSVNAVRLRDGSVVGEFELHAVTATGEFLAHTHVTITCFTIAGNVARLGGVVDRSTFTDVGMPGYITVVDNGEGANAPPDLVSGPGTGPGTDTAHCVTGLPRPLFPVDSGNIQIHPSGP